MTTTLEIDLAAILEQKYPHGFHAPADIEINNFLEFADDDWSHELDVDKLLADKQLVGIIWNVRLILDERPDLTDDQAWSALQACQPHFEQVTDPMRQTIRAVANDLFPKPQGKAVLRAMLTRIERRIKELPEDEQADPAMFGCLASIIDELARLLKRE